jgi:hypothetical protein
MLHVLPILSSLIWSSNWIWKIQILGHFPMQFSPASCHLFALGFKYSPQHPAPKHPQSVFLPQCNKVSHLEKTTGKLLFHIVYIFRRWEDTISLTACYQEFPKFNLLLISSMQVSCFATISRHSNFATFLKHMQSHGKTWTYT